MSIQGIFMSNQGIVGERTGDFANAILMINPTGTAPLLALTSGMGKAGANDTIFNWFEDAHQSGRATVVSGGTTTTVVVDDGSIYVPGTVLMVEDSGEFLLVTSVTGNSLTVVRGIGGTSIVAVDGTDFVQNVGNAHEESSDMPTAVTQQGAPRSNYTQIFRNAWAISGTATAVTFRTGSKLAHNKRFCAIYHAEDMERAFIWSRKHIGVLNGKQFRMTDGLNAQIESYGGTVDAAATGSSAGDLSRKDLEEFIRKVFAKNVKGQPNERIAFCGDMVLQVINNMTWLDGVNQFNMEETKIGIKVTKVLTPFGVLNLMTHPLMNENPVWQHELYVYHPGGIRRRVLRDTFENNYDKDGNRIEGVDADQGVMTTEVGIECAAAQTMGIMTNIQEAVASYPAP